MYKVMAMLHHLSSNYFVCYAVIAMLHHLSNKNVILAFSLLNISELP